MCDHASKRVCGSFLYCLRFYVPVNSYSHAERVSSHVGISGTTAIDWWWFGGVSADTTILHAFLPTPACTACTDMVNSQELERDFTTTAMAKAILRLETLAFIPSYNMIDSIFLRLKYE